MSQEWLESSPVTIKQDKDKIIYEVEYKERDYKTTPGDVLVNIYKYIRDILSHILSVQHHIYHDICAQLEIKTASKVYIF